MRTLIMTVGLPRSGKSTWAKRSGYPVVNRDAIRLAIHGHAFIAEAEDMVTMIEDYMVKALFLAGNTTVVVDATHTTYKRRSRWINHPWMLRNNIHVEVKIFYTPTIVCIQRAVLDDRKDLIPVIERMAAETDIEQLRETGGV